jgi:hypothetical protein
MSTALQILALALAFSGFLRWRSSKNHPKIQSAALVLIALALMPLAYWCDDQAAREEAKVQSDLAWWHNKLLGLSAAEGISRGLKHQGELLVLLPKEVDDNRERLAALKEGLSKIPGLSLSFRFLSPESADISAAGRGATWEDFNKMLAQRGKTPVVLSFISLPYCQASDDLEAGLTSIDSKKFRLVVTEAYADPIGQPIVEGRIAMTVFIDSKGFSLPLPDDDAAAAAQLYQALHIDNLEELDKKHPDWLIFPN